MKERERGLQSLLADLSAAARRRGWSDAAWAREAGLPKESLSRLRRRQDCDWATLERLSAVLSLQLAMRRAVDPELTPDGHFPAALTREDEQQLHELVRTGHSDSARWRECGPSFFMAGLAVLVGGSPRLDRPELLQTAETLHPGITSPDVYNIWLRRTPVEPSRFFAQLGAGG
jgi:hypothetical protein